MGIPQLQALVEKTIKDADARFKGLRQQANVTLTTLGEIKEQLQDLRSSVQGLESRLDERESTKA